MPEFGLKCDEFLGQGFNGPDSCGERAPCATGCTVSWKDPKIAPVPNPAQVVHVNDSAKSRDWDVQFTHCERQKPRGGPSGLFDFESLLSLIGSAVHPTV